VNRPFARLRALNWHFGCKPSDVQGPALIFCPHLPNRLNCGLAGLVAVKAADGAKPVDFSEGFGRIQNFGLDRVLDEEVALTQYLGGRASLKSTLDEVFRLKQDIAAQYEHYLDRCVRLQGLSSDLNAFLREQDELLEKNTTRFTSAENELIGEHLVILRDIVWGLSEDLLCNQDKIAALWQSPEQPPASAYRRLNRINAILNSLDRLEVRGRDSTGIRLSFVVEPAALSGLMARIEQAGFGAELERRLNRGDLMDGSINLDGHIAAFTYKTASVSGRLGLNGRRLRESIQADKLFKLFVAAPGDDEVILAHTRWASVGAINETNCHPLNNHVTGQPGFERDYPRYGKGQWFISVALNGDIDNHLELRPELDGEGLSAAAGVTTDTKVIPLVIEKHLKRGADLREAFRLALNEFEGSHAIAMESNLEPGLTFLAQRGSGQSLYIGFAPGQYTYASEIYGLVEETRSFIKLDGEIERVAGDKHSCGQLVVLDSRKCGFAGLSGQWYDGASLDFKPESQQRAEITTRDIDRAGFSHYLIKEILDAPTSIKKTLRGKYALSDGKVKFNLGDDVLPEKTRQAFKDGSFRRIYVVGQGTAYVAGSAIAEALRIYLDQTDLNVIAKTASDLSGFGLADDLGDTLVIAVTQSGTTTDTNRAVTMARQRGAHVIAIVNRRQSDITTKSDGVYYTSDGRDIEMSVASTKAFYSQIAAGYVLALYLAQLTGAIADERIASELANLERVPRLMLRVIAKREEIRLSAQEVVRKKRYWAVVGSGTNKVASDEVRIKLSELCYKTISSDIIEDKKHIDLSSEPLILVMAAGSPEIVLEDIVKDTAIFKAHAASVVVIADEGEDRFNTVADHVVTVPRTAFPLSVILNTLAGHIWGYYAASSLDEQAESFKDLRAKLTGIVARQEEQGLSVFEAVNDSELKRLLDGFAVDFGRKRANLATLNVDTATDLNLLLKYAAGKLPLEDLSRDFPKAVKGASPLDLLDQTLARAIEELSRPIDAIRHQAKTVTVGTSRKAEALTGPLFELIAAQGFGSEALRARDGFALKRLQRAVKDVKGFTLYAVEGLDELGRPSEQTSLRITAKGGVAEGMRSRYENGAALKGSKRSIVTSGDVYAGRGKSDEAAIIVVPLIGDERVIANLLLVHVDFDDDLSRADKAFVLGDKLSEIRNAVNEYNLEWRDECLESLPIASLLGETVEALATAIKNNASEVKHG